MPTLKLKSVSVACLALAPCLACAQVQVYGRLNVAIEHFRSSTDSVSRESNNRSVLGFRGSEDLGDGLHAIFQIEGTVSPDAGAGAVAARDTRVGLEGKFGTIFAGNWTTPYSAATSGLDPFYPTTAGYMSIMGNGAASSADNASDTSSFDRRQQNSVHYWSPNWNGFSLRIARGLNEETPSSGARPALSSGAAIYEQGPLYLALAHERHHAYQGPGRDDQASKLAAAYRFGATRIAVVVERLSYDTPKGSLDRNACYLSASHQIGPHGIRFGVARAGDGTGSASQKIGFAKAGPHTGATHYSLGYDYTLSKRTSLYAYATRLRNDDNSVVDFAINSVGAKAGATMTGSALGMRHSF
jgi:predicted porin